MSYKQVICADVRSRALLAIARTHVFVAAKVVQQATRRLAALGSRATGDIPNLAQAALRQNSLWWALSTERGYWGRGAPWC